MAIAVTTRSYDNTRSGSNTQETVLTAGNVATHGVRRLSRHHVTLAGLRSAPPAPASAPAAWPAG